ncbi:MAG: TIGR04282 family arsenosugar biosynthesis glycosyltransferase [Ginsengibacter sp.]
MKHALIIFVKNPERGKVKTRLANTLGDEKALEIYISLLEHTRSIVTLLNVDKFVFYFDTPNYNDVWPNIIFNKKQQYGNDLGERMMNAFNEIFETGYERVSIIGSDCIELTGTIILTAFKELESSDIVIGPAADGGYYFLGMKKLHTALFYNIKWSTANVLEETIAGCDKEHLTYKLLPVLNDIDEAEDWLKASERFSLWSALLFLHTMKSMASVTLSKN